MTKKKKLKLGCEISNLEHDYGVLFGNSYQKVGGGPHRNAQESVAKMLK